MIEQHNIKLLLDMVEDLLYYDLLTRLRPFPEYKDRQELWIFREKERKKRELGN